MKLFDMYEKEKLLLVSIIMFSGKKGLDKFILVMNNKLICGRTSCLTEEEMKNVLSYIGMSDSKIEQTMIAINDEMDINKDKTSKKSNKKERVGV